jgi:hypothetical protein
MRRVFNRTRVTRVQLSRTLSFSLCSFLVSIARARVCEEVRVRELERESARIFFFRVLSPPSEHKGKRLGFQSEFLFRGSVLRRFFFTKQRERELRACVHSLSLSLSFKRSERFSLFFFRPRRFMRRRRSFLRPSVYSRFFMCVVDVQHKGDSSVLETR